MSQIKTTTITSPLLTKLAEHALKNKDSYLYDPLGSFEEDAIGEEIWNIPRNHSSRDINDVVTFRIEELLQNETNGIVKLLSLYQEGDFLGWHTNSAVQGYNLILTYSESENSYFETEAGKVYDTLGWTYKLNEFNENPFWHRAVAYGTRITLSMLFENEADRAHAITTIQNLDLDF
jgi:hypothetical protein